MCIILSRVIPYILSDSRNRGRIAMKDSLSQRGANEIIQTTIENNKQTIQ